MTYQEFLKWEPELTESLRMRILEVLASMGDDIKGISWFSVMAPEYCAEKYGDNKVYPVNFHTTIRQKSNTKRAKTEDFTPAHIGVSIKKAA